MFSIIEKYSNLLFPIEISKLVLLSESIVYTPAVRKGYTGYVKSHVICKYHISYVLLFCLRTSEYHTSSSMMEMRLFVWIVAHVDLNNFMHEWRKKGFTV